MSAIVVSGEPHGAPDGCRLEVDIDGGLVRLRSRYDPALVDEIRALPGRRFIRERAEWVLPARRKALVELAALVDRLGDDARTTDRAGPRLERARPGRIESREGMFELSFAYDPRRLARVRSIRGRRYEPGRRIWTVASTRAGALALLTLLEEGEFIAEPALAERLARVAAKRESARPAKGGAEPGRRAGVEQRSSPAPHWRHVTRGPIFEANTHRHEWVEGIGRCVRIRVDPGRRRQRERR